MISVNAAISFILCLPKSLLFNFYYLPIRQAVKLPVLLFGSKIVSLKGEVRIESKVVRFGMIRLGLRQNQLYNLNGSSFNWENRGGLCVFRGDCRIDAGSAVSIGPNGNLSIGDNCIMGPCFRLCSSTGIHIGSNFRASWEVTILDNDFHEVVNVVSGKRSVPLMPVVIGNNTWLGMRVLVFKGSTTPDFCIVGALSVLTGPREYPSYSFIAGAPPVLISSGVYRDINTSFD